jgi:hypothetical protein
MTILDASVLSQNRHYIFPTTWTFKLPAAKLCPSPTRGRAIPPDTPHSIIVSLPEWEDNVQLSKGDKLLCNSLETTYPRFQFQWFVKQVRYHMPFDSCFLLFFSYV